MEIIADLHLHSKYSRAVSKQMNLESMAKAAERKGISLLTTGDFTHPLWFEELKRELNESKPGVYELKNIKSGVKYIIGTEISCIYSQGGKGRRVHVLVFVPSLEVAIRVNKTMQARGLNLSSDGRPIIGLSLIELAKLLFEIDERVVIIPAHVWTPWFGMLGSKSGFDSMRETFGDYADKIYAIETGLSSDPGMNWQIEEFDRLTIVSFSDAHSVEKIGREATILEGEGDFSYDSYLKSLKKEGDWKIGKTIEFYPEEGKYHVDGHRACEIWQTSAETLRRGRICPVCGKELTLGVEGRVGELSRRDRVGVIKSINEVGLRCYSSTNSNRTTYIKLVPLLEIIGETMKKGNHTKTVMDIYSSMLEEFGSELGILMKCNLKELIGYNERIGKAIGKVRLGDISIQPGYDGVFGRVKIWEKIEGKNKEREQMTLF
jgi:uncharacterized protein (TIGR00375 family)